jgi:hypothetical protein
VGSIPYEVSGVDIILPACTMALGSTQPPTDMSTKYLPESKGRQTRENHKLTAIYGSTV